MKKLLRVGVLIVAKVLVLLLATACSPGEADYYDAAHAMPLLRRRHAGLSG